MHFKPKRTAAASRGFLAIARLSCYQIYINDALWDSNESSQFGIKRSKVKVMTE